MSLSPSPSCVCTCVCVRVCVFVCARLHDSFIYARTNFYVPWLNHMWHVEFICAMAQCDTTLMRHIQMCHDSYAVLCNLSTAVHNPFIYEAIRSYVKRTIHAWWTVFIHAIFHSYVRWLHHMCHHSFMLTWLIPTWYEWFIIDITLWCATWHIIIFLCHSMPWLCHTCHASFVCDVTQ